MALRRSGLLWPSLLAIPALAVLLGLGTWQMQRKTWKEGLSAAIAARTKAPAIAIDQAIERFSHGEDLEYTRVRISGRWDHGRERYLWVPTSAGPGWHVYTPLLLAEAAAGGVRAVIVNRGYVLDALRDRAKRPEPAEPRVDLVGLLRKPETKRLFTPENHPERNIWYWRDLSAMASSMFGGKSRELAAFSLDAEGPTSPPPAPQGAATRLELPNNHLQYAVTWYGLALTLVGVYAAFVRARLKNR